MQCVHSYSPDLKNAEGVTPLELASSPDLQKALRTHLNLITPEKLSRDQNATASLENETEMSACATEATKVNETLEEMFADQESVEQEIVKPSVDIEQLDTELVEAEQEAVDDDQNVGAVIEEENHQESEPLEDSVDEVEEISTHIVAKMEVEVKSEADEEANVCGTERKVEDIDPPLPVAAAVSPDSNKENLGSSSLDSDPQEKGDEDKEKSPSMMLGGLRKPKNPFTEIRRSTSSSRAAMLVSFVCG